MTTTNAADSSALDATTRSATVKRVVLTGGPCGGKSTVQAMLSDVFANLGWKVYRVPETATTLLSGGVSFAELDADQAYAFQRDLLLVMLRIEQTYFNLAASDAAAGRRAIVLCDRGTMDANIDKPSWQRILAEVNATEVELRDQRYDCVVHLVTAADGAEAFYSHESNNVRSEGVELARELDQLCQRAWIGHPYYDIVDNSVGFDDKCQRVVGSLLKRLGLDDKRYGVDICKFKFLVDPSFAMSPDFPVPYQDFTVEHIYLHTTDSADKQIRIRRRTQNGVSHFNLTERDTVRNIERRRPLTGREYESLKSQADPMRASILKRRRCFLWNARYFQLDLFLGDIVANGSSASSTPTNASMMLLEAYLPKDGAESSVASTNMALLPPFVPVVRDITMDRSYSMFELSAKMSGCR